MIDLLVDNPLLTLFGVVAIGSLIGRVRIGSFSLGVAAVLFTGLAVTALWPELELPPIVFQLGLVLFVYSLGLAAGPGFLASLRGGGIGLNAIGLAIILVAGAEALVLATVLGLDAITSAGMFAGALTNTPALAGILDAVPQVSDSPNAEALAGHAVVGYSLAYPIGVLGAIASMSVLQRVWRIDHDAEARAAGLGPMDIDHWTVQVTRTDLPTIGSVSRACGARVTASRLRSAAGLHAPAGDERMRHGDVVLLVGTPDALERAAGWLGTRLEEDLSGDDAMDMRRVFVSNPALVGTPLRELRLPEQHGVTITRIRHGDVDVLATPSAVLHLGDRVRLVAPRHAIARASSLFGDSYRTLSELHILPFALGICLGLLVGLIPLPIPGGATVHLGIAGGPLLVALVLGAVGQTGPLVWQMPYSANLTVRQVGVVLFLAGIGTRAGQELGTALSDPESLLVIGAGAVLTLTVSLATLVLAYKVLHAPFGLAMGLLGGLQTQPAVFAYADEEVGSELADRGYTTVYPMAMVVKIVLAQVLLITLI